MHTSNQFCSVSHPVLAGRSSTNQHRANQQNTISEEVVSKICLFNIQSIACGCYLFDRTLFHSFIRTVATWPPTNPFHSKNEIAATCCVLLGTVSVCVHSLCTKYTVARTNAKIKWFFSLNCSSSIFSLALGISVSASKNALQWKINRVQYTYIVVFDINANTWGVYRISK